MPVWYPNRTQWAVIWAGFALALLLWMSNKEFLDFHLFIVVAVVLLVWMLEARRKQKP